MQKRNFRRLSVVLGSIIMILGIASFALADWGQGHNRGSGWHHGGYGQQGMYDKNNCQGLSDKEIESLKKEREVFLKATEDLRQQVYEKKMALRAELAKKSPDTEKAAKIQTEISELQGPLDQKRVAHQIAMKKINPNAGRGYFGKGSRGYGHGYCRR